jgi:lactoylglutathione lyase
MNPLFLKVDCHSLPVPDLDAGVRFYESLGHELIWRDDTAAGFRLPDSNAELVLHADDRPIETDFSVASVPDAVRAFVEAGGRLVHGPFDIRIGLCAVMRDPWDNPIVILDASTGLLAVDREGNVLGNAPTASE